VPRSINCDVVSYNIYYIHTRSTFSGIAVQLGQYCALMVAMKIDSLIYIVNKCVYVVRNNVLIWRLGQELEFAYASTYM
jgi:hypothetical protein